MIIYITAPFKWFFKLEAASGLVLLIAAVIALILSNTNLKEFYKETNVPVLLNTSFNIKGQPIVNTSEDAIKCFLKYNINCLVLGNYILEKK